MSLALLLDPAGRVVASSYPARYRASDPIGGSGAGVASAKFGVSPLLVATKGGGSGVTSDGEVIWASVPVLRLAAGAEGFELSAKGDPKAAAGAPDLLGAVYVQVPSAGLPAPASPFPASSALSTGLLVLLAALPVGVVFGLLSTRRLIGRLRRLAATTVAVAGGDFGQRVPVSGGDEVAQLERNFNRMAERLDAAMATERQLAGAGERARIARELHDSISQELFSLHLLAGGLRKALPSDSPLHAQVETMEQTTTNTMQEMQALLLELRPVALAGAGLVPALEELSRAYRERLGVTVEAVLEPVRLTPPVEHAVLRIVQEALANAVKHGRPARIRLRLDHEEGRPVVTVEDDGGGFDPTLAERRHGLGLRLMRERVAEIGGSFQLDTGPGKGTRVRVVLPGEGP
jgi:two-component system, NarL family, sensor histidine kinase LiaS